MRREMDLLWLRQSIAVVMQEPVLFAGTIRSNIVLAKPDALEVAIASWDNF
jgi:ABC-type multidrug transport system fused ATPase/permease subunit